MLLGRVFSEDVKRVCSCETRLQPENRFKKFKLSQEGVSNVSERQSEPVNGVSERSEQSERSKAERCCQKRNCL